MAAEVGVAIRCPRRQASRDADILPRLRRSHPFDRPRENPGRTRDTGQTTGQLSAGGPSVKEPAAPQSRRLDAARRGGHDSTGQITSNAHRRVRRSSSSFVMAPSTSARATRTPSRWQTLRTPQSALRNRCRSKPSICACSGALAVSTDAAESRPTRTPPAPARGPADGGALCNGRGRQNGKPETGNRRRETGQQLGSAFRCLAAARSDGAGLFGSGPPVGRRQA